jgi:hypothetical protein
LKSFFTPKFKTSLPTLKKCQQILFASIKATYCDTFQGDKLQSVYSIYHHFANVVCAAKLQNTHAITERRELHVSVMNGGAKRSREDESKRVRAHNDPNYLIIKQVCWWAEAERRDVARSLRSKPRRHAHALTYSQSPACNVCWLNRRRRRRPPSA